MKKYQILILSLTLLAFGILIFFPHFYYPYPFHVDEWHHITEAKRLTNPGDYFHWLQSAPGRSVSGLEIGFQLLLLLLGKIFNLILIYKFLPAIWAMFTGLTLFFVAYKKSGRNFIIAWLALLFLATIRTNTNLTGLWFFTPLSFSFPFIFLYSYFLSEGLLTKNKKYSLYGLAIMLGLIIFHPLSVLFSLPIFAIFVIINYREILKEKWFWLIPLLIGGVGLIFFSLIFGYNPIRALGQILNMLKFSRGWGVLELNNSYLELYPLIAWFWAAIGAIYLFQKNRKSYSFYLLWPIVLILSTIFYRLIDISYFSPFQRNLYYLTLALPLLSAYGLYYFNKETLPQLLKNWPNKEMTAQVMSLVLIILTFILGFINYYSLPPQSKLYRIMTGDDYQTIKFLETRPETIVMATPFIGTALIAQTKHIPVGAISFYGISRDKNITFYLKNDCAKKKEIIDSTQATIVYWPKAFGVLPCPWLKNIHEARESFIYSVIKN